MKDFLSNYDIPTAIYYPKALTQQEAYSSYPCLNNNKIVSEKLSKDVLSLPMHPYLTKNEQELIIEKIKKFHA